MDPDFKFNPFTKIKNVIKDAANLRNRYYATTSANFFRVHEKEDGEPFDVIFVDGLHTYEQSLADVVTGLNFLNERGTILIHDCNPPSAAAAVESRSREEVARAEPEGEQGPWCGDVWKTIVDLRSNYDNVFVSVVDCDFGIGVVQFGAPFDTLGFSKAEIRTMNYAELAADRNRLLGLQSAESFLQTFGHDDR